MISQSTVKKLQKLSSDLVSVDASSPLEEWKSVSGQAEVLAGEFLQAGESDAQEMAQLLVDVASSLAKGIIANPGQGVKSIQNLIGVLQGMETPAGMSAALRKQAHAEAQLFFRDVKKEESRVSEEVDFEDEEERREVIIAIEQRVDELEGDLLNLNPPESDSETVRAIFRQFHTLKGEGAISGIKSVAEFCHGIETEIEDARSGNLVLTQGIVSVLQELTPILRPILAGEEVGEDLIRPLMDELRAAVAASKQAGAPEKPAEPEASGEGADPFADFFSRFAPPPPVEDKPEEGGENADACGEAEIRREEGRALAENMSASDFLDALGLGDDAPASPAPPVPPAPEPIPEGVGDADVDDPFGTGVGKGDTALVPAIHRDEDGDFRAVGRKNSPGGDTVIESGDLTRIGSGAQPARKEAAEKKIDDSRMKAVTIDVTHLDNLLEIVGEVSLLGSYITNNLAGDEKMSLQSTNLVRACGRLQEVANSLRMTSIRPLFMTVRRAAADAARASRKLIDINMQGIDTQVDRSIVENLSAALIHIVRNAVDHGIEPADARRQAGKPERGIVMISATRTNSDIVIELGDDGKGFDLKAIHDKAVGMGKIAPDAVLTPEAAADLVFLPGLSTAKKITGLSGRGVGMEIVRQSIDNLRGKVEIRTTEGKGTTIRMRFPLMVAAMDAMLVRVGDNILAFPVAQVRECFRPAEKDIGTIEDKGTIVTIRGIILPVLFLGREFGIHGEAEAPEDGVLVVVETGEMLTAVLVDETIGSANVVIRSMEGSLASSNLVAGAAILPGGAIGLVIETARLTEKVATTAAKAFSDAGNRQAASSRQVDTVSIGSNQVGMIDFNITAPGRNGNPRTHVFAINAFKTREFVPLSTLRSIPGSPSGFAGIMMLRDVTVPVIHMGVVLGLMSESERRPEWERIVLICEFAGRTVGFLVTSVERVSYISWSDIMPPPSTGGLIQIEYIVGTILMSCLKGTLADKSAESEKEIDGGGEGSRAAGKPRRGGDGAQVAFVLDFERIVGNVMQLYGDMGSELGNIDSSRKDGIRILLVEDSPLIRKKTNKALTAAGITVIEAGDGQEAWDKMGEMRSKADSDKTSIFSLVDLILTDIEMPRMDGYTLTYNIKHDPVLRVLPVLLHSSITNDNMIGRATEVEADGFIAKCDPKELAVQLRKYL